MKNLFIKSISIICITALSLTTFNSCKKYPDGPAFSLMTKKARLCGSWQMEKYIVDGTDQTTFFYTVLPGYVIEVKKDETYTSTYIAGTIETGKWEFTNNKKDLKTTVNNTGEVVVQQILKLENKALWIKHTETNGSIIELHLKAK